jgi:hypothetical protein
MEVIKAPITTNQIMDITAKSLGYKLKYYDTAKAKGWYILISNKKTPGKLPTKIIVHINEEYSAITTSHSQKRIENKFKKVMKELYTDRFGLECIEQ